MVQVGSLIGNPPSPPPPPPPNPMIYRVSLTIAARSVECPLEVCSEGSMRTNLRIHFLYCHIWDTIVILEEDNHPHPRILAFDIFVPWLVLKHHLPTSVICMWGTNSNRNML